MKCELCHKVGYIGLNGDLTKHHSIPKHYLKKREITKLIILCNECHRFIHKTFKLRDLKLFNTVERMKEHLRVKLYLKEKKCQ